MGIFLSLLAGFLPMFLFAGFIYWLDRYEKEPKILLGGAFIWGALVAAGVAYLVNTLLGISIFLLTSSETATDIATGSLIAPVVEEVLKGFAVLIVFLAWHSEFDSILDGIVYAAVTALGFAATENAFYIFTYGYQSDGMTGLLGMFVVRVLLVGWQHPFYTAFTGIGLAAARLDRSPWVKIVAPLAGLSLAIITHSAHNTIASLFSGAGGLILGTLFDWSGWIFMLIFILWMIRRERNWLVEQLKEEISLGNLTPHQYQLACSSWSQSWARFNALFAGKYRATARFFQVCGELSHKKHQLSTQGEEDGNQQKITLLRAELQNLSPLAFA